MVAMVHSQNHLSPIILGQSQHLLLMVHGQIINCPLFHSVHIHVSFPLSILPMVRYHSTYYTQPQPPPLSSTMFIDPSTSSPPMVHGQITQCFLSPLFRINSHSTSFTLATFYLVPIYAKSLFFSIFPHGPL